MKQFISLRIWEDQEAYHRHESSTHGMSLSDVETSYSEAGCTISTFFNEEAQAVTTQSQWAGFLILLGKRLGYNLIEVKEDL